MTRVRRRDGAGPRADPAASHLVRLLRPLITFSGCVLVVACLYWGQAILIPIALAVLITFLLGPVVSVLRRVACLRLGRAPCRDLDRVGGGRDWVGARSSSNDSGA